MSNAGEMVSSNRVEMSRSESRAGFTKTATGTAVRHCSIEHADPCAVDDILVDCAAVHNRGCFYVGVFNSVRNNFVFGIIRLEENLISAAADENYSIKLTYN